MNKNTKTKRTKPVSEHEELLIATILDFYRKHKGYRLSQGEFVGLICALSQQVMSDIQWLVFLKLFYNYKRIPEFTNH